MKTKSMMMLFVAFLISAVLLGGCKKKEPSTPAPPAEPNATASAVTEIEQTMCPVMHDMKINKDVFTEYKGKKVYFCCNDCKAKFEADPEKYISKLPQFKQ
jgi:YHS domain-containing protein